MKSTRLLQEKISAKRSWSLSCWIISVGKPFYPAERAALLPEKFARKVNGMLKPKSQIPMTLHIQYGRQICTV